MSILGSPWLDLFAAAIIGFALGRLTAKSSEQRDREQKSYEARLRQLRSRISPETQEAIRTLLRNGKKIEAIKRLRNDLGTGLKESKDLVEAWDQ